MRRIGVATSRIVVAAALLVLAGVLPEGAAGQGGTQRPVAPGQPRTGGGIAGALSLNPGNCNGGIVTAVGSSGQRCLRPKDRFRDCDTTCPEMVMVQAGAFDMGTPDSEKKRDDDEGPVHRVTFAAPFAVGRLAVTRGEYLAFVSATGMRLSTSCGTINASGGPVETGNIQGTNTRDPGFAQEDSHPAVCVSWADAKAYVDWLSQRTGKTYRLLSEAEREYITRAGTKTAFWMGNGISPTQANYDGTVAPYVGGGSKGVYRAKTVPADMFQPNPWGFYNVHGNVDEWTEDCYHEDGYDGAPTDGTAWGASTCGTNDRVARGGSWYGIPDHLRSGFRYGFDPTIRGNNVGFRVARSLD
ncbi:MAG: formylglycine-generating enzyme family protein [Bauldia sp.]